ncbi:MAG: helix-turn-helix transcriptional regulator [Verrucomicrobiaceae bacterium]|nr:helix-turn-helix transcriptional regulator [Verrucomicrobiaceae bacterium]
MNADSADISPAASAPQASQPSQPGVSPLAAIMAMADPMRFAVLKELADGSYPPVIQLAKKLGCHPDQMGRHLQRMKKAGLLIRVRPTGDPDMRSKHYQIPSQYRQTLPDGVRVLDYGTVVLRFEPGK